MCCTITCQHRFASRRVQGASTCIWTVGRRTMQCRLV
jgi:hypothetical protein